MNSSILVKVILLKKSYFKDMTFILFDVETLEINIATLTFFIQAFTKYLSRQTQL